MNKVKLISFGFKYGIQVRKMQAEADKIIDCRDMANPHNVQNLRELTGLDEEVKEFVKNDPLYPDIVSKVLWDCQHSADNEMTFAFGCVGGKHRSVAVASGVASSLRVLGIETEVIHAALHHNTSGG